jgi:hypothetical protein
MPELLEPRIVLPGGGYATPNPASGAPTAVVTPSTEPLRKAAFR